VRVHAEGERRIGVPELGHHIAGIAAERDEDRRVEDVAAQITAAEHLLNRLYGKPRQALEQTGAGGGPIEVANAGLDLRKLSDLELEQLVELLTRASPDR
jgi:hypothetical protein